MREGSGSFILHYLSHPQVRVDSSVPVPHWSLSPEGRARVEHFAASLFLDGIGRLVSSPETKALETVAPIAARLNLPVIIAPASHENDRSATGFLPPAEFEAVANRFFSRPEESVRGWERANDAAARIERAVTAALAGFSGGRALVVGHGAVGTLLACRLANRPISRAFDQPPGGGNLWTARWPGGGLVHDWRPMEAVAAGEG